MGRGYILLTLTNIFLIIFCAYIVVSNWQALIEMLLIISILYVLFWIFLGWLCRANILKGIIKKDIWISMIPNVILVIFLFFTGSNAHLGFLNSILAYSVLPSILIIPILFNYIKAKKT